MPPATPPRSLDPGVAAALLAGATLAQGLPALPPLAVSAVACALALVALGRPSRGFASPRDSAARIAAIVLLGAAWACAVGAWRLHSRWPEARSGDTVQVEGRIAGLPRLADDALRFDLDVDVADAPGLVGERVRVGWYGAVPRTPPEPGSRWRLALGLKTPRGPANPGGPDLERRSLAAGIVANGTVRMPKRARELSGGAGIDAWRERASQRIAIAVPDARARFVRALALGDTRAFSDEDWERLRATGLTHQVAISGFHVGLVAAFGALLARLLLLPWARAARCIARPPLVAGSAFLAALGYTAVAGFALPTVRTLLMIGAVLLARAARRHASATDGLALAVIALLALDPLAVLAPGFWLSVAGVACLLWCLPSDLSRGERIAAFVHAQGVAVVGLLPLSVWFFGQASLPGPLANLLGVPVISLLVVPLSLLGLLADALGVAGSASCWEAAAAVMQLLWQVLGAMAAWPFAAWWLPEPGLAALLLACAGAFWLLLPRGVPGKPLALLLWLPLLWPDLHRPADEAADIEVLDVGHGLAVLVTTRTHALLYDTGPAGLHLGDAGERVVVPALRARGIRRLDSVVVSHGDRDHAGGLDAVRRAFPGVRVLGPEGWARPGMGLCRRGQHWRWDGVDFRVLHPPPDFPYLRNDSSCVLRVSAGGRVVLLTGDIGRHVEARLAQLEGADLRADVVLAPHHGSRSSSSDAFIAATRPALVLFGTGWRDRFGLPRQDVVQRWRAAGALPLATGDTGAIALRLERGRPPVPRLRRADRRYWRAPAVDASGYAIGTSPDR
jgi:competence protein ComEC